MKRKRLPPEALKVEKHRVFQFVLNHVSPDERVKFLPISDIFENYRKTHRTGLSVDGFGRLFPKKIYQRKSITQDGKTFKAVVGVRLV